jgi:hypothetical protein
MHRKEDQNVFKPNFIVIGSMKCGTTTLCHLLGQHPGVFMSHSKEPEFFCKKEIYSRGWDWYLSLFADVKKETAIGEGSTSYTKAPLFSQVPERISKHLPHVRLIYIVRHPLERIESHWMHRVRHGDTRSLKKMLQHYPNLIDTSRYWYQVQQYRKYFSDDQILVLFFDELKTSPGKVLEKCFRFLNVDHRLKLANPSEHLYPTRQFKVESKLLKRARANAGLGFASRFIPFRLKSFLKEQLAVRVNGRPAWDPAKRRWVIREIADDVRTFLDFYGKPADFWNMNGL